MPAARLVLTGVVVVVDRLAGVAVTPGTVTPAVATLSLSSLSVISFGGIDRWL